MRGFNEVVTWSFVSEVEVVFFGGGDWMLANLISEDLKVMRFLLLLGLVVVACCNADRGVGTIS